MDRRFSFQEITKSEIKLEILNLNSSKACQESDLPTKIIKANSDTFTEFIHKELKRGLEVDQRKVIINVSAYCQIYQKSLKDVSTRRCLNFVKE